MDEDQDRMYVGCKDHVLSMDINNISQTTLKVREQSKPLYINNSSAAVETNGDHISSFTSHLTNGGDAVWLNSAGS